MYIVSGKYGRPKQNANTQNITQSNDTYTA